MLFYSGYAPPHAVLRLVSAGRDLTENLMQLATEQECPFGTTAERESVREVKEKQCHSSLHHDTELKSTAEVDKEKIYELPDENFFTVGAKRFRCVEVLLHPCSTGKEAIGLHDPSLPSNMK